jgi:hypothetical protein
LWVYLLISLKTTICVDLYGSSENDTNLLDAENISGRDTCKIHIQKENERGPSAPGIY